MTVVRGHGFNCAEGGFEQVVIGDRCYTAQEVADTLERAAEQRSALVLAGETLMRLDATNAALSDRVLALADALWRIARWEGEFPPTGRTWDDGTPMSYAACWGAQGERDYMRGVARQALGVEL